MARGLMKGTIVAIYIASEAGAIQQEVQSAALVAGRGIVGDRYERRAGTFSEKLQSGQDWEVTLIEQEEIQRFNGTRDKALAPGLFRRNVVTAGIRLNDLVGRRFRVGGAMLEGMRLCEPCAYLAGLLGPEILRAMAHKAGLRARILEGAVIHPGEEVVESAT